MNADIRTCPNCGEKALAVDPKGLTHCFACGYSGTVDTST